jgi:outer membrane protein assembly factor BamB
MAGRTHFAVLVLVVISAAPHGHAADSWAMWQGDAAHSGYAPKTLFFAERRFAWSKFARPAAITGMAVSSTAVFATDSPTSQYSSSPPATLGAQDLSDGHTLWSISFPTGTAISAPAFADGMLFFVENLYGGFDIPDTRYLDAVDAATGNPVFRVPLALAGTMFDSPTVAGGHIYFESRVDPSPIGPLSTTAYWFGSASEQTGTLEWQSQTAAGDGRVPTLVDDRLYGCTTQLNILDPATGATISSIANPDDAVDLCSGAAPAVAGSFAYANQGTALVAFDLTAGKVAWSVDHNAGGQVSTDGSRVFYLSSGALTVRDAATGALLWGWEAPQQQIGNYATLSDNLIVTKSHVIVTDGTYLYFINRDSHFLDGSFKVAGLIAYAADKVVVGDAQGVVTVFELPADELFFNGFE